MEQRIGFGKRLGALFLDLVIVCVAAFFAGGPIGAMLGVAGGAAVGQRPGAAALGGLMGALIGMALAAALISLVYFLVEGFTGYTLGKFLLGIRIANADGTEAPVSQLLTRYAVKHSNEILRMVGFFLGAPIIIRLGGLAGLIVFVGCFLALSADKQALHDRIAKTAVYPKTAVRPA